MINSAKHLELKFKSTSTFKELIKTFVNISSLKLITKIGIRDSIIINSEKENVF
jgi:hypothetical protein